MGRIAILFLVFSAMATLLDSKAANGKRWNRTKRQARIILNPPIPTSIGHYLGGSPLPIDRCPRDEVLFSDGRCHQLLTQGPCTIDQYLLLDPSNNKPYCAQRLCQVDRIFVFGDQMCHDPLTSDLCPPGRQLYETMYGTPICQCPDGTYEGDDDLDDDVCEPLLGQSLQCPRGQVFWFRDFNRPPGCVPDPCGGDNLNRGPRDLPFVPFSDGRCFQLGSMPNVCPGQTWYSIALEKLEGVCSTLEDAGYQVLEPDTLNALTDLYGPLIPKARTSPIPVSSVGPGPAIPVKPITNNILTVEKGPNTILSIDKRPNSIDISFGKPGASIQGSPTLSGGNQGPFAPGLISTNQGTFGQGIGSANQGFFGQGFGSTNQGSPNQGAFGQGVSSSGQSGFGPEVGGTVQGTFGQGIGTPTQGALQPGTLGSGQGATNQGGFGTPINFPSSSSGPGFSQRPPSPFGIDQSGIFPSPGSSLSINQAANDQSLELLGGFDDDGFDRSPLHHILGHQVSDLSVQEAKLLANIDVPAPSGGPVGDISLLQAPPGHQLHGFFNSVRALVNNGPHNRSRRSPLPHASPGNVFETRLAGCRAGASRDVNAKCRNTILPPRDPARPTTPVPPVPPRKGCPNGQQFNIQRMCISTGNAIDSINRFNLGK